MPTLAPKTTKISPDTTITVMFMIFDRRFEELVGYAEAMESMMTREAHRLDARVRRELAAMSDEDRRRVYVEDMSEEWERLSTTFPNTLRKSLLVQCAADFEHALHQVATYYEKRSERNLKLNDLRGDGIQKSKLYFDKVVEVPFPSDLPEWALILAFAEMRNQIVHNDGKIPATADKLQKLELLAAKWPTVVNLANGRITLGASLIEQAIKTYQTFLPELRRRLLAKEKSGGG